MTTETKTKRRRGRYCFFPNPYKDNAFSRCPQCGRKTKIRKFPLVIHVDPDQVLLINKKCRYCVKCVLIITKKEELESMMVMSIEDKRPEVIGNDYLALGVLSKENWHAGNKGNLNAKEIIERVEIFKDVLNFEPVGGWIKAD